MKAKADVKIAVLGDIMCDEYLHCTVSGVSPESDSALKLRIESRACRPGGAANVALNLASLGAGVVHLYGHIADDQAGRDIRSALVSSGVELRSPSLPGYHTTVKSRVLTRMGNHICRLDNERIHTSDTVILPLLGVRSFGQYDAIVVSDYDKGVITQESMAGLKRLGVPFFVDPKKRDWSIYDGAEAITPNEYEVFYQFQSTARSEVFPVPAKRLIITRGNRGCTLVWRKMKDGKEDGLEIPVASKQVGDPTGCGDSFLAGLVLSRCCGKDWVASCIYANACGAVAFGQVGAIAVKAGAVERELNLNEAVYRRSAATEIGEGDEA